MRQVSAQKYSVNSTPRLHLPSTLSTRSMEPFKSFYTSEGKEFPSALKATLKRSSLDSHYRNQMASGRIPISRHCPRFSATHVSSLDYNVRLGRGNCRQYGKSDSEAPPEGQFGESNAKSDPSQFMSGFMRVLLTKADFSDASGKPLLQLRKACNFSHSGLVFILARFEFNIYS